jgi:Family of unknown function (DUF6404)
MKSTSTKHRQKVVYFQKMLRDRQEFISTPIIWTILWKMGVEVPPPQFMPYLQAVALASISRFFSSGLIIFVAALFKSSLWIFFWDSWPFLVVLVAISSILSGLLGAIPWRKTVKRMQLGKWEDFPDP